MSGEFDDEVARLLKQGGVGLLPADTIYGLSCLALNKPAVERVRALKNRGKSKPFVVLFSRLEQLNDLGVETSDAEPANAYWPGKLTIICAAPAAPDWLHMGTQSLAIRQPGNPALLDLIVKTGPLVSTSANLTGGRPAESIPKARKYFGAKLDFYVDHGKISGEPSTIVKAALGKLEVIREGAVRIRKGELS